MKDSINLPFVEDVVLELKKKVPSDDQVTIHNILGILSKIKKKRYLGDIFYSRMTFLSVCWVVTSLYVRGYLRLSKSSDSRITVSFPTGIRIEVPLKSCEDFHLITSKMESEKNIVKMMEIISERDFEPSLTYSQSFYTFESLKRRFNVMSYYDDITDKRIIFLGDDELFSVFCALNGCPKNITVVDIDIRILNYIQKINDKYGLNIQTFQCDFRESFPEELSSKYDVFFASGLKDLGGLVLFISRGFTTLKDFIGGTGYFTFYSYNKYGKDVVLEYRLQKLISKMNCFLDCIVPCEELEIPKNLIEDVASLLQEAGNEANPERVWHTVNAKLKENAQLMQDPSFPLISIQPVSLAKIRTTGKLTNLPFKFSRLLTVLRKKES